MTLAVDTSAVLAVIFGEPDAEFYLAAMLESAGDLQMSAVTAVEIGIVVEARHGPEATADLNLLQDRLAVTIAPVDASQAAAAVACWRRFGKGRHPAGLDMGDCFAYALAKLRGLPLLYKGRDFDQTDISSFV